MPLVILNREGDHKRVYLRGGDMKVVLESGDSITVEVEDGTFVIDLDSKGNFKLTVTANMSDSTKREGVIYEENCRDAVVVPTRSEINPEDEEPDCEHDWHEKDPGAEDGFLVCQECGWDTARKHYKTNEEPHNEGDALPASTFHCRKCAETADVQFCGCWEEGGDEYQCDAHKVGNVLNDHH